MGWNLSDAIHGKVPDVATFQETDPIEMLKKLLSGEISDWPQIQQLGQLFQNTMFDQLSSAIPNIRDLFKMGGENTEQAQKTALQLQKGELPPEDIAAIFRTSAGQNLKAGTLFSGMGGANALRNIGMGTLEAQLKGQDLATSAGNAAQRWMAMAQGTMLPSSAYLYSPEWFTQFMAQQAAAKLANKQLKLNAAAAPDPAWADRAKMLASLLGSFAGPGGSQMGQYASGTYGQVAGSMGGAAGAMGGPSGGMAGAYGSNALNFNNQNQGLNQNQGFLSNFWNAYNSPDPNYQTHGVGGNIGGWLGGIFNAGGG